ncbi:MAG: hypothetical protein K2X41_14505 [Hyphomicrobium sp.]|nr:hypothetical protein [Hyphomicrobium sp.]
MTAQRLLNVIALAALVVTIAALLIWQQSGEPPPVWLRRIAIAGWIAALVIASIGAKTRPRLMLRFLSALFALIAVVAAIADWSRPPLPGGALGATTLLDYLTNFTPSLISAIETAISRTTSPKLWSPVLTSVLDLPAWLIFAGFAVLTGYAGRPRRDVRVFVN